MSALIMAVNAPPTMTPTAISNTLPREIKSLNSLKNFFIFYLLYLRIVYGLNYISGLSACQANFQSDISAFIKALRKAPPLSACGGRV